MLREEVDMLWGRQSGIGGGSVRDEVLSGPVKAWGVVSRAELTLAEDFASSVGTTGTKLKLLPLI
jgi:hypothetical protein